MFVSYAQNYEDVMLWRALKHVGAGVYVDVGANDPVVDSVTKAFYEAGWHGINIEPVQEFYEKIRSDRPEDINLMTAVGEQDGTMTFHEVVGTGLSTMDRDLAERHAREHGFAVRSYDMPVTTLTRLLQHHRQPDIHFLKIDVEGAELSVLRGLDLDSIRPWVIVVESTLANSQIENYTEWEGCITSHNYHYVYFDGLNRFYVADEQGHLDAAFSSPPNYFDRFIRAREHFLQIRVSEQERSLSEADAWIGLLDKHDLDLGAQMLALQEQAARDAAALRDREGRLAAATKTLARRAAQIADLTASLSQARAEQDALSAQLAAIYASTSWRITAPLRWAKALLRRLGTVPAAALSRGLAVPRRLARPLLTRAIAFARQHPALKSRLLRGLRRFPTLEAHLRRFAVARGMAVAPSWRRGAPFPVSKKGRSGGQLDPSLCHLAPRARDFHDQLTQAIAQARRENR